AVPMTDFQAIDPGGDLRILARAADAGGVPVLQAPGLEPLLGGAGELINLWRPFRSARVSAGGKTSRLAVGARFGEDLKGLDGEGPRHFAPQVPNVATFMIVHIHLETLSLVGATEEDAGVGAPIR